jgi:hypothetical protein
MPARKRAAPEDAAAARRLLLDGLARDADLSQLASRAAPLPLEGLREQFMPEAAVRGRQNRKFQYAALAAAALHGGTEPDLLEEAAWWQADDFWQYALFAAVAYVRAAASRGASRSGRHARNWANDPATQRRSSKSRDQEKPLTRR